MADLAKNLRPVAAEDEEDSDDDELLTGDAPEEEGEGELEPEGVDDSEDA